jgi:hypothetical protein
MRRTISGAGRRRWWPRRASSATEPVRARADACVSVRAAASARAGPRVRTVASIFTKNPNVTLTDANGTATWRFPEAAQILWPGNTSKVARIPHALWHTHTHPHAHMRMHGHTHAHPHARTHMHAHAIARTRARARAHTHSHTNTHTHTATHASMHARTHTHHARAQVPQWHGWCYPGYSVDAEAQTCVSHTHAHRRAHTRTHATRTHATRTHTHKHTLTRARARARCTPCAPGFFTPSGSPDPKTGFHHELHPGEPRALSQSCEYSPVGVRGYSPVGAREYYLWGYVSTLPALDDSAVITCSAVQARHVPGVWVFNRLRDMPARCAPLAPIIPRRFAYCRRAVHARCGWQGRTSPTKVPPRRRSPLLQIAAQCCYK